MRTGLFPMCADLLHAGHCLALAEAKSHCDKLIVALNCLPDNKQPIQSVYERWVQLSASKYVDEVVVYAGEKDLELLVAHVNHNIRFVGADYRGMEYTGKEIEDRDNVRTVYISRRHNLSSTELKERITKSKRNK